MSTRILFRSDTRHPIKDNIFNLGFKPWEPTKIEKVRSKWEKQIYQPGRKGKVGGVVMQAAGDIDSNYAVCLSQRIAGAALFPYNKKDRDPSWMYAVEVDEKDVFSTHNKQIHDGFKLAQVRGGKYVGQAWWAIYAHEVAVKQVDGNQVICAAPCLRSMADYYQIMDGSLKINGSCRVDKKIKDLVVSILKEEGKGGWRPRAQRKMGYHK